MLLDGIARRSWLLEDAHHTSRNRLCITKAKIICNNYWLVLKINLLNPCLEISEYDSSPIFKVNKEHWFSLKCVQITFIVVADLSHWVAQNRTRRPGVSFRLQTSNETTTRLEISCIGNFNNTQVIYCNSFILRKKWKTGPFHKKKIISGLQNEITFRYIWKLQTN